MSLHLAPVLYASWGAPSVEEGGGIDCEGAMGTTLMLTALEWGGYFRRTYVPCVSGRQVCQVAYVGAPQHEMAAKRLDQWDNIGPTKNTKMLLNVRKACSWHRTTCDILQTNELNGAALVLDQGSANVSSHGSCCTFLAQHFLTG